MTTRAGLRSKLQLSSSAPTKTFVLDVHTNDPDSYLAELVSPSRPIPTEDASLFEVNLPSGDFFIDQLGGRFWSFHTDMPMKSARGYLNERVSQRRDLDWVWLPSQHLRRAAMSGSARGIRTGFRGERLLGAEAGTSRLNLQAFGSEAGGVLEYLARSDEYRSAVSLDSIQVLVGDSDEGWLNEGVGRLGNFQASGESLELHFQFVRSVVARYSALVALLEDKAIAWEPFDSSGEERGGRLVGAPVTIAFSREVPDMERFVDELFACRVPFRLWGIPEIADGVAAVDAVDLHVGHRLRMDIGPTWMRVYLERGACGNTVARLVSNLQHRFDSALEIVDSELNAAFSADASTPT